MISIETLQTKVDQVKIDLTSLKKETNETIKKTKVETLEKEIKTTEESIRKELEALKGFTDTTSIENSAKLEAMLLILETSDTELTTLKTAITNAPIIPPKKDRNWIQGQRDGVTNKEEWKTNTLANVARVAGGIGVAALAWKGIKWLFGIGKDKNENGNKNEDKNDDKNEDKEEEKKEKKEKKEEKSRGEKALIWTGILGGTVGAGILGYKYWSEIKGWFLDLIGKNLTFDEAMIKVKSDLGGVSESDLNVALGLKYDEKKGVIISYGEEIKIDKKKKRVEGLDVSFSNYEEMIHAANIINYSKATYKGKCASDTPFYITSAGGDIEVHLLDDYQKEVISGEGIPAGAIAGGVVGSIGALVAGYFLGPKAGAVVGLGAIPAGIALGSYVGDGRSTLAKICPKLADGIGKKKLLICLNSIPNLTQGDQEYEPDNKTPLQKDVNAVIKEIKDTETDEEFDQQGNARNLKADIDPKDPMSYTIKSRGRLGQTKLKFIEGKRIKIEGLDIEFTDIKEGIKTANLTNKIRSEYAGKCTKNPFSYKSGLITLGHPGLYATDGETNRDPTNWVPYRIISKEMLESRYPTLLKNIETKYIPYLHKMKSEHNRSLRIIPNK